VSCASSPRRRLSKRPAVGCRDRASGYLQPSARTLLQLLDDYRLRFYPDAAQEFDDFHRLGFARTFELAGDGKLPSGKHHPHLYRISKAALAEGKARMRRSFESLRSAADFEAIHDQTRQIAALVRGLKAMWAYDTAFALAAARGLRPMAIHLHRGTAEGARYFGIAHRPAWEPRDWPSAFHDAGLDAAHLENFLCIYKKDLRRLRSRSALRDVMP